MPVINGRDSEGNYYQFGLTGKKYYYIQGNMKSRTQARRKALKQMRAIELSKHQGQRVDRSGKGRYPKDPLDEIY